MNLRAEVYNSFQFRCALKNPHIESVYVPYSIVQKEHSIFNEKIILIPPLYLADCEEKLVKKFVLLKQMGFKKVLVHSIGHIELFSSLGFDLYGGYRLNCINSESLQFFTENNVKDIILSPETSLNNLSVSCDNKAGIIVYGYLPLMITRRCPIKNGTTCDKKCCNRYITDRKGRKLNIICNENTAEILNSDVLYLADKLNLLKKASFGVLKFTVEEDIDEIVSDYVNFAPCNSKKFTRGLY